MGNTRATFPRVLGTWRGCGCERRCWASPLLRNIVTTRLGEATVSVAKLANVIYYYLANSSTDYLIHPPLQLTHAGDARLTMLLDYGLPVFPESGSAWDLSVIAKVCVWTFPLRPAVHIISAVCSDALVARCLCVTCRSVHHGLGYISLGERPKGNRMPSKSSTVQA
jgi:hypothetical protein